MIRRRKENRRDRIRRLTTTAGMRTAALTQQQRRGTAETHRLVVGGFRMAEGRVTLYAVEQGPALDIVRPIRLTNEAARFYCWRTKQAARQFAARHELADVHVVDLRWLDVLPVHADAAPAADVTPPGTTADVPGQLPMFPEAPLPAGQSIGGEGAACE